MSRPGPYVTFAVPSTRPLGTTSKPADPGIPYGPGVKNLVELVHRVFVMYGNERADKVREENVNMFVSNMRAAAREAVDKFQAAGYLIEVEVRKFSSTGVAAAHNDLIKMVGPGMSPTDALRGSLGISRVGAGPAGGTVYDWERSFFIWLRLDGGGLRTEIVERPRALYNSARFAVRSKSTSEKRRFRDLYKMVRQYSQLTEEVASALERRSLEGSRGTGGPKWLRELGESHKAGVLAYIRAKEHLEKAERAEKRAWWAGAVAGVFGLGADAVGGVRGLAADSRARKRSEELRRDVEGLGKKVAEFQKRINENARSNGFNSIRVYKWESYWDGGKGDRFPPANDRLP